MALSSFGLLKTSLIDFPGEVAAVLFTFGCNLRCPYCHNPTLVSGPPPEDFLPRSEILKFLEKRKDVLGGVCITGGEPLLHPDLGQLIAEIKAIGLKVKLDTNGTFPDRLSELKVDYIAIDLKTSLDKYGLLIGEDTHGNTFPELQGVVERIRSSIRWIVDSGIPHEIRTTVVPQIVSENDIASMIDLVQGANHWVLAGFRPNVTLNPEYRDVAPYPESVLEKMKQLIEAKGIRCAIRNVKF
jgi:pyruvate formate lyase activating enzyme